MSSSRPSTAPGAYPQTLGHSAGPSGTLRSLRQRFSLSRTLTSQSATPSPGFHPLPLPSSPPQQQVPPGCFPPSTPNQNPAPSPVPSQISHLPSPAPSAPPTIASSKGHTKRRSFGLFGGKGKRAPSGPGISSSDFGRFFPDGYEGGWRDGRPTLEMARPAEFGYSQPAQGRNTLDIPREPVPTNGYPPGIGNLAYMHPQHYDRPLSPAYLSPAASPQAVQFAGIPSATFYAPNIRSYSPQPPQAPSPAPSSAGFGLPHGSYERSPNAPFSLPLDEDPALTLSRMRDAVAQIQGMVESVAARAASPLPLRSSTPQGHAHAREQEQLAQSASDTTISSIATITPAPRKAPPTPLTLTLTPSSPDPPRSVSINPPWRSDTEPTMPRTRTSTEGGRPTGGEVLFQRAISPLAQQRNSMESQRSASGRGTSLISPGMRSASVTSTRAGAASPDVNGVMLTEAEKRMPWRERIALRREARQAAERAELGVRPPSASTDTRRHHQTHSRNASGASEYFSVRGRSPSLSTPMEDLRVEDLRPQSRGTDDPEAEADADAEDSREIEERDRAAARTADWLGAGPGRRALRAAGLLDEIQEKKESYPPTSGTRTARRGRRTPSSASHSSATHRRVSGSETPSLSIPARSVSGTPSLTIDSAQTPTTTTTTFSDVSSPPGLAQVLELHNLEKGALLGALQESKRREREREEETRRLGAELELLRARIRELEAALAKAQQQQQQQPQAPRKSRLPMPKPRVPSGGSSVDRPMVFAPHRPAVRRSDSASTLGAPQVPISPPSSGGSHSRSGSDSPTRVHRAFPLECAHSVNATPTKHTAVEEQYVDSGSESESLRLRTEDERHLQEFVDVTLGAPSDDESFY
ncbi:hypothetical protein CALVIDRAFT_562881 [Calocera viscosa TUFC12733]|uniref:Uncharacterized protein n=1 Tax=Calocera viscosa (strain TUFC12733) TaxID=1330018 RepID=A0A167NAY2_CALVF|nr:hypothetical protein CALVIDRAFT_562881 [Calocera viscosa TUFC12733]